MNLGTAGNTLVHDIVKERVRMHMCVAAEYVFCAWMWCEHKCVICNVYVVCSLVCL